MPLAAPSCFTWVVIFLCACTEGLSKYIKDDITSTHPGMEGKWLYRWPTKAAREAFKTILGGSGNFSKHSDSEEVLFNFFFLIMLFPWKIPLDYSQLIMLGEAIFTPVLTP